MKACDIDMSIGQLNIEGFSRSESLRIQEAFSQHLSSALAEVAKEGGDLAQAPRASASENLAIQLADGSAEQIGRRAARQLVRQLWPKT